MPAGVLLQTPLPVAFSKVGEHQRLCCNKIRLMIPYFGIPVSMDELKQWPACSSSALFFLLLSKGSKPLQVPDLGGAHNGPEGRHGLPPPPPPRWSSPQPPARGDPSQPGRATYPERSQVDAIQAPGGAIAGHGAGSPCAWPAFPGLQQPPPPTAPRPGARRLLAPPRRTNGPRGSALLGEPAHHRRAAPRRKPGMPSRKTRAQQLAGPGLPPQSEGEDAAPPPPARQLARRHFLGKKFARK